MKRVYIVLLLHVCTLLLFAQHKIGVTIGGMTASQLDNIDITTSQLGYAGEVGAVYQLQKKSFLFQTGVGVDYAVLLQNIDSVSLAKEMVDAYGIKFTYRSLFYDRIDRADVVELSVPLMFGAKFSSFYALLGAKFIYPLSVQTSQSAKLTSHADYNGMFYEDFENMPQHGYVNAQPMYSKGKIDFNYDVRACVELGGNFDLTESAKGNAIQLALGVFAEYGVLNTLASSNNNLIDIDYENYQNTKMSHVYSTKLPSNAVVNNLRVGLRATILFPVAGEGNARHNKKCMCIDYIYRKHPAYRKRR